jgi:hypothetical protein
MFWMKPAETWLPRDRLVDHYPWFWVGLVLVFAAVHVGRGRENMRAGRPFGWFDLVAAVTFVALAGWIVFRQRSRRSEG